MRRYLYAETKNPNMGDEQISLLEMAHVARRYGIRNHEFEQIADLPVDKTIHIAGLIISRTE